MEITDVTILSYLHDATVHEVAYDLRDENDRSMRLSVECDPAAGYSRWDGKRLDVRLESIVLASFSVFGALAGTEQINSWGTSVSEAMESEVRRLQAAGCDCRGVRFVISFQSGSVLEGLCKCITVEESFVRGEQ